MSFFIPSIPAPIHDNTKHTTNSTNTKEVLRCTMSTNTKERVKNHVGNNDVQYDCPVETMPETEQHEQEQNTENTEQTEHVDKTNDRREILRPYKHKRLGFEGVLIDLIEPNRRNGYTYGLVFASVYSASQNIELDHAVIKMGIAEFNQANLDLFERYYFTAVVKNYYKTGYILGIAAKIECFMLADINPHKIQKLNMSKLQQPTAYVINRIDNVLISKIIAPRHTKEELIEHVLNMPNDGSVERFINEYTQSYQNVEITKYEVINTLYA